MSVFIPVGDEFTIDEITSKVVCVEDDPSAVVPCSACCFWGMARPCGKHECRSGYRKDGKGVHFELREKGGAE